MDDKRVKPMDFSENTPQDVTGSMAGFVAIVIGAIAGQGGYAMDESTVKAIYDAYDRGEPGVAPFSEQSGEGLMRAFRSGVARGWVNTLAKGSSTDREEARMAVALNCSQQAMSLMKQIAEHCTSGGRVVLIRDEHYSGSFDQQARMAAHAMLSALGKLFEVESVAPDSGEGVHAMVIKAVKQDTGQNMAGLFEAAQRLRNLLANQKAEPPVHPEAGATSKADAEVASLIQRVRGSRGKPNDEK